MFRHLERIRIATAVVLLGTLAGSGLAGFVAPHACRPTARLAPSRSCAHSAACCCTGLDGGAACACQPKQGPLPAPADVPRNTVRAEWTPWTLATQLVVVDRTADRTAGVSRPAGFLFVPDSIQARLCVWLN
jgi:hypothetical protein